LEVEEEDAEEKTDDDADAGGKVLGDVVGVVDAQRGQHAADGLEDDGSPHDAVVSVEETVLGNLGPVVDDDADDERREKRVK
jgi:hypothetical protein